MKGHDFTRANKSYARNLRCIRLKSASKQMRRFTKGHDFSRADKSQARSAFPSAEGAGL